MAKKKEKELLCTTHDKIDNLGDELKEIGETMNEMTLEDMKKLPRQLVKMGKEIKKLAWYAKDSGIHMENRLYEYYNAIQDLGFTRTKE